MNEPRSALLMAALLASLAIGQNILIHDDSDSVGVMPLPGPAEAACISLGYTYMTTPDWATFISQLNGGSCWDVAVVLHVNLSAVPTAPQLDDLLSFYNTGGRVVFFSWNLVNQGLTGHPLFAAMGATPLTGTSAVAQNHWVPGDPLLAGMANPIPLTDYVGFGVDGMLVNAVAPATAVFGQTTPTPSVGNGGCVVSGARDAVFLGAMPHLMQPSPGTGNAFMENVLSDVLSTWVAPSDFSSTTGMTITPTSVAPGSTFDVDVEVTSTSPVPEIVRVDLFYGPGEPVPGIPGVGLLNTAILVPAGGSEIASFTGIPAPPTPEIWRLHALINSDLAVAECITSNNVVTDTLCISAPPGCGPTCGDCDENATFVTILDALVAAQISAGLSSPTMNQQCVCDVDSTMTITILDALLMAQISAGLSTMYGCSGSGGGGGAPALALLAPTGVDPVILEFDVCGPPTVDVSIEFTTDAGATYAPATAAVSSSLANPAMGVAAGTLVFDWDSNADVPIGMRPQTAELRVAVIDPVTAAAVSDVSSSVMLQAGICTGTVEQILSGMPLPITVPGSTAGADDTVAISCVSGGSDHVFLFHPPMTAQYRFSLCASSYDTALEVREMDCTGPLIVGCIDDACGLQSELIFPSLTAGTPYYIVVDGWNGSTGSYSLTITSP